MKRVAVFGLALEREIRLGSYVLYPVGKSIAWSGCATVGRRLLTHGFSGILRSRLVLEARGVDELYRERDAQYLRNCEQLLREIEGADAVVFFTYPFLHPEILAARRGSRKFIMGFVDDPHSTYVRGLPYVWAYDGAFYISPSYSADSSFDELLRRAGVRRRFWLPLVQPVPIPSLSYEDILKREAGVCYVGNPTFTKVERLARVKRALGDDFTVHGRWPFGGYAGFLRVLVGERGYYRRVHAIEPADKRELYLRTKIALNMHVSDVPSECGNMRTYEAASHGMLLLCDRGASNLQTQILRENEEAIYYDDIGDAIAKACKFLGDDERRAEIAYRGYLRAKEQYTFETVWQSLCSWIFAADAEAR
ncbi:glycosyltransferase [Steroidobacter cummioxidans]|uniref:glycosyltransferase family protein n=1 Tax=Steroidobacter cummioxidans TaxID=1803913 RepID=UPI000E31978E|nr:glycosyltransferase [Steroidobacter cummioxidans]